MIKLIDVSKVYESKSALSNINIEIDDASLVVVVGESGSGKSTLGKIISRLTNPTEGMVEVNGKVGVIFQEYSSSINPIFTVFEVLKEVFVIKKEKIQMEKIYEVLNFVSLNNIDINSKANILSGGEKQRLVIARAILYDPDIFIFDEAISSLDVHLQFQIIEIVRKLNLEYQKTIIFITHNIELIKYLSEDVIVLKNGEIIERGNVLKSCKNDYTKKILNIWK
ncbi:ATP-binding cassette domain-containing protein [Streptobacillus canis]|uniref:ATP-binding cassette domain-containing protein n=1 Tax=Streptobacillus canis TaxID=2678686 RepID=UPI0012E22542|nr:ATP-binding cassette domain-containing protein [Streptobacillus canis]